MKDLVRLSSEQEMHYCVHLLQNYIYHETYSNAKDN